MSRRLENSGSSRDTLQRVGLLLDIRPLRASKRFSTLWGAGIFMSIAGQIVQVALAWIIYETTESSLLVGLLGVAVGIPTVIFGLLGGSYADTRRPKVIGLVGASGQFLVLTSMAIYFAANGDPTQDSLWVIYVAVFLQISFGSFAAPTRRPYLRHLLGREMLPAASGLYMLSMHLGMIIGPLVGGLLIGQTSLAVVFTMSASVAGCYLAVVIFLPNIEPGQPGTRVSAALLEGIRLIWSEKPLRASLLLDLSVTALALPTALLPALNAKILDGGASEYGALVAALSIGGLVATVLSGRVTAAPRPGSLLVAVSLCWVGAIALLAAAPNHLLALSILFVVGVLDTAAMTTQSIVVQMAASDNLLGRVSSVQTVVGMAGPQLGNLRGGVLGSLFGPVTGIFIGAVAGLLAVGATAWGHPELKKFVVMKSEEKNV
jgi:MFS family permease